MDEEIDREVKFHLTNNSWVQEFFEKLLILKIDGWFFFIWKFLL